MSEHETAMIIGMGEVGTRLHDALRSAGWETVPVTREENWGRATGDEPGLRIVCVREEPLAGVIERLRHVGGERLVFVQNGWVDDELDGLGPTTRGLIWFTSKGEFFRVLRPSPFHGPAAERLAGAMTGSGLRVRDAETDAFFRDEAEKMGFNGVVGLPLAVHGVDLGTYLDRHRDEARELHGECVAAVAAARGVDVADDAWDRFVATVEPLGWMATATAKALRHRNGAVARLGRGHGVSTPVNDRLLSAAGWDG